MIKVSSLSYTYPGSEKPAIKNISLEIRKGEILGILGPSGAGKSTLQKSIIGLLSGYTGHIDFTGAVPGTRSFREQIGVMFEFPNLYENFTALENLKFFGGFYSREIRDPFSLLAAVGLEKDANKRVGEFSKGMKMRLNFIRAVMHNPSVLFLDEPTSGLDPVFADLVMTLVEKERDRGVTVLLTTHNMQAAARLADRLAFIVDGSLPIIDTPHSLIHAHGEDKVTVEYKREGKIEVKDYVLSSISEDSAFIEDIKRWKVISIHSAEATLDQVFAKVTGRKLHEEE